MNRLISLFSILIFANHLDLNAQSFFFQDLESGPYQVGFTVKYQYDYSRSYQPKYNYEGELEGENTNRLMQMAIWYPAQASATSDYMMLKEYFYLAEREDYLDPLSDEDKKELDLDLKGYKFLGHPIGGLKSMAIKEPKAQPGKFPLILYAPSLSASVEENLVLCEYLASHGFIVAAVPAKGTNSNNMQSGNLEDIETQYQDLSFLLNYLRDYPNVHFEKIGVIGYSIGGLSNIVLALKNYHIDAVVSLDGSIASEGYLGLMEDAYYFDPLKMRAAFLQISKNKNFPDRNPSTFLDQMRFADAHLIRFASLNHWDFSSSSIFFNYLFNPENEGENAIQAYPKQCKFTLEFMNAYLKKKEEALKFLVASPEENGWNGKLISKRYTKGKKIPPTQIQFLKMIRDQGAKKATKVFEEVAVENPEFKIFEKLEWRVLLQLGDELIEEDKWMEAIRVLDLNLKVYPDWYHTHYALARAWKEHGNKEKAVQHLKSCLNFHPRFEEAREMLAQLGEKKVYQSYKVANISNYLGKYQYDNTPETAIRIFQRNQKLMCEFISGNSEHHLIPDSKERFLMEDVNAQFYFQFDKDGKVKSMRMLGLNSGRYGAPRFKVN